MAADVAEVCRLWQMLLEVYNKNASAEVLQRSFRFAVAHPRQVRVFVAVVEGKIVGTASLHLGHYSTWNDNWYGHVEDVIVDPAYRHQGMGRCLVLQIIEEARREGLSRLELNALADNYTARRMYERIGFKTDSVVYELFLKQAE